jgi:diguanylate cyclase (GGDEF)-like protein
MHTPPDSARAQSPTPSKGFDWRGRLSLLSTTGDWRGSVSRLGLSANAEILLWQNKLRVGFGVAFGIVGVVLLTTVLPGGSARAVALIVVPYIAFAAAANLIIRRTRLAGLPLIVALVLADIGAIFGFVFQTAPAQYYAGALLLSLGALQLTYVVLGQVPSLVAVLASTAGYVALVALAKYGGAPLVWREELWMLALYLFVAINGILLQSGLKRRLAMLVDLFSQAERGDFTREYDERLDTKPDVITSLGRAYNHFRSQLGALVLTDPLTGCLNRRGFEQELRRSVANAARYGGELSILAIDVDHFKNVNDTWGHLAGDVVLRDLAELITNAARGGDLVARLGGEEFVVLLPHSDGESAGVVAERLMEAVRAHEFTNLRGGGRTRLTVSVGIAAEQIVDSGITSALRARADEALYVAKRLGRDRVVLWAPGIRSNATPPAANDIARLLRSS